MIRLTEEEIADSVAIFDIDMELDQNKRLLRCPAKAQLKKVVEWIEENSGLDVDDETSEPNGMRSFIDEDWQALLEEIK